MWYSKNYSNIKIASPFHATPNADKILEKGYIGGIPDYAPENHFIELFYALPEESQERIRQVADESENEIASWGEEYWPNVPEIMDAMYDEIENELPTAQMIWALDYPTKEQIDSYGPELVYFDDADMESLGETPDGLAYLYHPRNDDESPEYRIPPEYFRKVDPNDPKDWDRALYGWSFDDDEDDE